MIINQILNINNRQYEVKYLNNNEWAVVGKCNEYVRMIGGGEYAANPIIEFESLIFNVKYYISIPKCCGYSGADCVREAAKVLSFVSGYNLITDDKFERLVYSYNRDLDKRFRLKIKPVLYYDGSFGRDYSFYLLRDLIKLSHKCDSCLQKMCGEDNQYIYFIQNVENGTIKIGISNNPSKRLKNLQGANSSELRMLGFFDGDERDEKDFHYQFKDFNIRNEWFSGEIYNDVVKILSTSSKLTTSIDDNIDWKSITLAQIATPK